MKQFRWVIISVLLLVISSMLPLASNESVQAGTGNSSLEELTNGADSIIVGTVVERNSYWNDEHTGIYTSVVLSVEERFKGAASQDRITVTYIGGEVDELGLWVSDMPSFDQGEKAVVFLKKLPEEQFEVYGGFRGKFTIMEDKVANLPVAHFKERVSKVLEGQTLTDEELDVPSSLVISPYSYSGKCWPHPPSPVVNYLINENTADCINEGAAVQAAAATWNGAGAYFSFNYSGTTAATAVTQNFVNEILWRNFGSGPTIAHALIWAIGDTIVECDMEFNDYYTFSTAATPPSGQYDAQTIALHEFGHYLFLLDLYDDADSAKVMYGTGSSGTTKRTLHADDIAGIQSIYGALPVAPTVTNSIGASNIASTSARLNGEVTSTGSENPTVHIYWGSSDGGTTVGNWSHDVNLGVKAAGTFYTDISSLTAGTPYYYRCYAVNSGGGSWAASTSSFTTSAIAPTLTNYNGASNIASSSARLNGELTSTGGVNPTVHIYWGPGDSGTTPGNWAHDVNLGVKVSGTFYTDISSLTASTTYYYRCYAVNSGGGSWAASTTSFTTLKALVSIAVTPDNPTIAKGRSRQFTAMGTYTDSSQEDITASVTWTSDNTSVATIGPNTGLAQSLAEGTTTITATSGAISDTTILTVSAKVLDTLAITPDNPTIAKGRSQQFMATGTYSDLTTENLTASVTWTSDNTTVATIGEHDGLAQGLVEGHTTLFAVTGNATDTTLLTVSAKVVDTLAVTPASSTISSGRTQQFTATGTYSDLSTANLTSSVIWSSSNTTVARINAAGLVTSFAEGYIVVTATKGTVTGNATLNVGAHVLDSVTITPVDPEIIFVSSNPPTLPFIATASYSDGATATVTGSASWTSDNTTIATIDASGLAIMAAAGTTMISATYDSITGNTTLTVLPDTVAPVVTLISPTEGQTCNTTLTVSGMVDDVHATANVSVVSVNGTATSSLTINSGNFTGSVTLETGSNTILVRAVDGAGNTGTSGTVTVFVDTRKPSIILTNPQAGTVTNNSSLAVTGTVSGNVTSVNLITNGVSQTVSVAGGNFSASVNLVEGVNILVVNAYQGGHTGESAYLGTSGVRMVRRDTAAPSIVLSCPVAEAILGTPGCDVAGTVDDPCVSTVNMTLNSGTPQQIPVTGGAFSQKLTLTSGNNTLTVTANDDVGNSSTANVTITYDNSKPAVAITSPANGFVTKTATCPVAGTVSDASITSATLYFNGSPQAITVTPSGTYGVFSMSVTLVTGANTLEVRAGTGTSGNVTVTLDSIAPTITIGLSDPADSIAITVTSNEALAVEPNVSVNITTPVTMTLININKWSGTYGRAGAPLAEGAYTVTANATDRAGNTSTRTATFCKQTLTISENETATIQTSTTRLEISTTANVTNASVSVTQHLDNPSGNVGHPSGAEKAAGVYIDIVASPELRDNLKQIYIQVDYDPAQLPAGTDASSLKLYLWDVSSGTWQMVPGSGVNTTLHYIYGTFIHLSIYGGFGTLPPVPVPTPPTGGDGGGGGGGGSGGGVVGEKRITSIFSITTKMYKLSEDVEALSYDNKVKVFLKTGTEVKNAQGSFVISIVIEKLVSTPGAPANEEIIGSVYDIGPTGATFNPPITITFSYDPNNLPGGVSEQDLTLAWFDKNDSNWNVLEDSVVDTSNHTVTAHVSHFTPYAIIFHQKPVPPAPSTAPPEPPLLPVPPAPTPPLPTPTPTPAPRLASFIVTDLSITPNEARPAEEITISALVTNTGGSDGSYTVVLKINGMEEGKKEVTTGAGKSETVSFTITKDREGVFAVNINGKNGHFTVIVPPTVTTAPLATQPFQPQTNWGLIGGIICGVIVIAITIIFYIVRKRR